MSTTGFGKPTVKRMCAIELRTIFQNNYVLYYMDSRLSVSSARGPRSRNAHKSMYFQTRLSRKDEFEINTHRERKRSSIIIFSESPQPSPPNQAASVAERNTSQRSQGLVGSKESGTRPGRPSTRFEHPPHSLLFDMSATVP